jgi:sugar phosphate isomerase/epimerase
MKIGCCVWNFNPTYAAPYEDGIELAARLGFDGVELMVYSEEDLECYYTPKRIADLHALCGRHNLPISQLSVYDHVLCGLASLTSEKKKRAISNFEKCVEIAAGLQTGIVNTVSQWPEGLKGPISYPPSMIYIEIRGLDKFSPKLRLELPEKFDWKAIWDNYVDSVRQCTQIAKARGKVFALEGHCHVIVSGTDAFLRLYDHLKEDPALGVNFDTCWHFRQREYLPMSIRKLGKRIVHTHVRDSDGLVAYSLPPGQGILDWDEIIAALREVGFDGFLSLEMSHYRDPARYFKEAQEYLRKVIRADRNG